MPKSYLPNLLPLHNHIYIFISIWSSLSVLFRNCVC